MLLGNPGLDDYIVRIIDLSFAVPLLRGREENLVCYKLEKE